MLAGVTTPLNAQPSISANNLALGGGGAAYLNGYESNFYNPANLMIYDRKGRIHLGIGQGGAFFQPVLSTDNIQHQVSTFRNIYSPHILGSESISTEERELILDQHYPRNLRTSQHHTRAEMIWGGIQWQGRNQAFSLTARTRIGTRTEVGRGWYSYEYNDKGDLAIRDFHLASQSQVLHEISLGIAQEFEFINGLLPRINKLYAGIAPKFVISGAYMNTIFNGRYEQKKDSTSNTFFINNFSHYSSGSYSEMVQHYRETGNLQTSINEHINKSSLVAPNGYGLGIDFGLTYLIPLGNDVSILDNGQNRQPITKSLRIALSVTDLGLIYHQNSPLSIEQGSDTTRIGNQQPVQSKFVGSPGQFPAYFEEASLLPDPLLSSTSEVSEKSFSTLLPTSINAGVMLDLSRIKLMSDLTLALNKTAFAGTQLSAHFGMEIRPLPFFPIRVGTLFAANTPSRFGLGTGIETRYWNFSISSQVLLRKGMFSSEIVGGAVAGLQIHL